jgi:hypothetical protein
MSTPIFHNLDDAVISMNAEVDLSLAGLRDARKKEPNMRVQDIWRSLMRHMPPDMNVESAMLVAAVLYDRLTRP